MEGQVCRGLCCTRAMLTRAGAPRAGTQPCGVATRGPQAAGASTTLRTISARWATSPSSPTTGMRSLLSSSS
eukprot:5948866-Alexandrium_andersonii.AAC.1